MVDRDFYLVLTSAPARYCAAAVIFIVALLVRLTLMLPGVGPYVTFYPAVAVAFFLCGRGPGLFVFALSALAGIYGLSSDGWSLNFSHSGLITTITFSISALIISAVVHRLQLLSSRLEQTAERLRASEERFRAVVDDQDDVVCRFDRRGRVTFANAACLSLLGRTTEELGRISWQGVLPTEDLDEVDAKIAALSPGMPVVVSEHRIAHPSRGERWIEFVTHGFFRSDGRLEELQTVGRDVTERRALEESLARANDRLHYLSKLQEAMLNNELVGICRVKDGRFLWQNAALARMFQFAGHELAGAPVRTLYLADDDYAQVSQQASEAFERRLPYRTQLQLRRKDGASTWVDLSGTLLPSSEGESLWLMQDINALKVQQARLEQLASHDPLTGLPNRRFLMDRLRQMLAISDRLPARLAICFVDVDGFKGVNDRLGHDVGDLVLKELARRIRACLRAGDTVARLGGDEFVLLLCPLQTEREAYAVVSRVLESLSRSIDVDPKLQLSLSASIGVAFFPDDGPDGATLLQRADAAMYESKRAGGNCVTYCPQEAVATAADAPG